MRSAIKIRAGNSNDLHALLELERSTENAPHWSEASWKEALAASILRKDASTGGLRRSILVAEIDERLVGLLALQLVAGVAEIESLAVSPQHRRLGMARALCCEGIAWARGQDARAMELEVRASNAAAIGLYLALGFAEQGRRRGYYRDPVEDAVLMSRAL